MTSSRTQGTIRVALAGNPNAGKTTLFNKLTGVRQHVGNYPGVTVEKKEGTFRHDGVDINIVDLPGIYSLTASSIDELIARNYVINENPDVVVNVVDSSNLERNLYLAVQLMELEARLILVFNMSDIAESRGYSIDIDRLSSLFGVTIIKTVGNKGKGLKELKDAIVRAGSLPDQPKPAAVHYGREVEQEIERVSALLDDAHALAAGPNIRWLVLKLLEADPEIEERLPEHITNQAEVAAEIEHSRDRLQKHFGDAPEIVIADQRYGYISGACQEAVRLTVERRHTMSDRIDEIATSRVLGLPVFLLLMYTMFKITFTLSDPVMGWIDAFLGWLTATISSGWPAGQGQLLESLVVDGILGGVGGVLVFLPNIVLLFAAIAILEDSGYMARAAFVTDRLMHRIGLHGKSFIPMLIGFGCTVPAILATRTLESRRDRMTTMLVLPLISCGARLPIYTLFIPAFFSVKWRTPVLMSLYLIGILMALLLARLLRSTVFSGQAATFVMELPPYRMPTAHGILIHTWERSWLFLRKAGTVILAISVILWALSSYPRLPQKTIQELNPDHVRAAEISYSITGRIGHTLEPIMKPIGFDWKTTTALIGAFAAKEVFVAQLGIVHSLGESDKDPQPLRTILANEYSTLQAFCIMLFCLISMPCAATVAATVKESGSWKWGLVQLCGLTALAYVITFVVYQAGQLVAATG
jgi:ferrous iron transport protein B